MRRRALLAAGLAAFAVGLLGRSSGGQRAPRITPDRPHRTAMTGPRPRTPWYPGAVKQRYPEQLYENGQTPEEQRIAASMPCACFSERRPR